MAEIDGAHALKSSSEESYQFECNPCENDGITKQAKFFCLQCKEYLCQSCERSHKRFRGTRNHRVVCGEMIPENVDESQLTDINSMRCPCARNELEMYCTNHNEVFCSDCKVIKHRHCETNLVDEMFKEATDVDDVTSSRANEVKEKLMTVKYNRKQDLEKLTTERENCNEKIASFRKELNRHLDELEEKAINGLDESTETHKEIVKQHLATCSVALRTLSFDMDSYEKAKSSRDVRQRYLTNHKLQQTCQDLDTVFEDLNKELYEPNVSVERNKSLSSLLSVDSFCTLNHNLRGGSKLFTSAEKEIISSHEVNVRFPSDQNVPWISGSVFLKNGEIVLCDRNNSCLKVLDPSFAKKDDQYSVNLSGKPRDCCLINEIEVLVTMPEKQQIQWFQIRPVIKLKKTFDLDRMCEGVASLKNDIFVTYHEIPDKGVKIIDQDGNVKRNISLNEDAENFRRPFYISVDGTGAIYVSETSNDDFSSQIRSFTKDGDVKYKSFTRQLKGAVGLFIGNDQQILVCFWKSDSVKLLNKDGAIISEFLSPGDIRQPYSLSFRENDASLVVTMRDTDKMLVCKIK